MNTKEKITNLIESYQNLDYDNMVKLFKAIPHDERHKLNEFVIERYSPFFVDRLAKTMLNKGCFNVQE